MVPAVNTSTETTSPAPDTDAWGPGDAARPPRPEQCSNLKEHHCTTNVTASTACTITTLGCLSHDLTRVTGSVDNGYSVSLAAPV